MTVEDLVMALLVAALGLIVWIIKGVITTVRDNTIRIVKLEEKIKNRVARGHWAVNPEDNGDGNGDKFLD